MLTQYQLKATSLGMRLQVFVKLIDLGGNYDFESSGGSPTQITHALKNHRSFGNT